jgi:hypothetical protein
MFETIKEEMDSMISSESKLRNKLLIENLKSALESAQYRKHVMIKAGSNDNGITMICEDCRMGFNVLKNPMSNETFISGEAVSLVCFGKEI